MYFSACSMIHRELVSASSLVAPQAVVPWPPRMVPTACGFASLIAAMSRPSWKPGRRHGTQATFSPKISLVRASPSAAVAIAMPGVRVQVVHVGGVDEPVHGGVDRGGGAALAVQAVIERGHHLVFTLDAGVDVLECLQPVQAEDREPGFGQRAEVAAGALDPQELDVLAGHGVLVGALGGGVAAGEIGVPLVRPKAVGAGNQLFNGWIGHGLRLPIRPGGRLGGPALMCSW